jgi:hypothetical protein
MSEEFDRKTGDTIIIKRISNGAVILNEQFDFRNLKVIDTKLGKIRSKELDMILTSRIVIIPTGSLKDFFENKYC